MHPFINVRVQPRGMWQDSERLVNNVSGAVADEIAAAHIDAPKSAAPDGSSPAWACDTRARRLADKGQTRMASSGRRPPELQGAAVAQPDREEP
jgi:hypothetical protein